MMLALLIGGTISVKEFGKWLAKKYSLRAVPFVGWVLMGIDIVVLADTIASWYEHKTFNDAINGNNQNVIYTTIRVKANSSWWRVWYNEGYINKYYNEGLAVLRGTINTVISTEELEAIFD